MYRDSLYAYCLLYLWTCGPVVLGWNVLFADGSKSLGEKQVFDLTNSSHLYLTNLLIHKQGFKWQKDTYLDAMAHGYLQPVFYYISIASKFTEIHLTFSCSSGCTGWQNYVRSTNCILYSRYFYHRHGCKSVGIWHIESLASYALDGAVVADKITVVYDAVNQRRSTSLDVMHRRSFE